MDTTEQIKLPEVENYVSHLLRTTKPRPAITWQNFAGELNWFNVVLLIAVPVMGIIGACFTKLRWETALFSIFYYFFTGLGSSFAVILFSMLNSTLGITAGYHRCWAHRCYKASTFLQYFLAIAGAGAVQGSIKWWARGHRAHHRYGAFEFSLTRRGTYPIRQIH